MMPLRARATRSLHAISGGSDFDTPLVAALMSRAWLCAECLVDKTGAPLARVQEAIERMATTLRVTTRRGPCDACLQEKTVHRLG